jgi:hypothetical protein
VHKGRSGSHLTVRGTMLNVSIQPLHTW